MQALLLLWLVLSVVQRGEMAMSCRVFVEGGQPTALFSLRSHAARPLRFSLPEGCPLEPVSGRGVVFLAAPLEVELRPGQQNEFRLPLVSVDSPQPGAYQISLNRGHKSHFLAVRSILQYARDGHLRSPAVLVGRYLLMPVGQRQQRIIAEISQPELRQNLTDDLAFLSPAPVPLAEGMARLEIAGDYSYDLQADRLSLTLPEIRCLSPVGFTSQPLKATLWATQQGTYRGGSLTGYRLGEFEIGSLSGGSRMNTRAWSGPLRPPPPGSYFMLFTIEERTPDGYRVSAFGNFSRKRDF